MDEVVKTFKYLTSMSIFGNASYQFTSNRFALSEYDQAEYQISDFLRDKLIHACLLSSAYLGITNIGGYYEKETKNKVEPSYQKLMLRALCVCPRFEAIYDKFPRPMEELTNFLLVHVGNVK